MTHASKAKLRTKPIFFILMAGLQKFTAAFWLSRKTSETYFFGCKIASNTKLHLFTKMLCVAVVTNRLHKTHQNYHLFIDRLSFIHKTVNCVHQTWRTQATKHPASDVHSRRSPRLPWYLAPCQLWESFLTESQRTLWTGYFTTVSQQMLTVIKHVAGDNVVFGRTAHWHIMHATQSNCRRANSQLHLF